MSLQKENNLESFIRSHDDLEIRCKSLQSQVERLKRENSELKDQIVALGLALQDSATIQSTATSSASWSSSSRHSSWNSNFNESKPASIRNNNATAAAASYESPTS